MYFPGTFVAIVIQPSMFPSVVVKIIYESSMTQRRRDFLIYLKFIHNTKAYTFPPERIFLAGG